ncbi:DEAD/DEAH box helicase [Shewanella sp. GXUN23E]|uniref:DEAD/DEAH box helicase n=1 Tax=Shewanella sp. GXUN23E TaxID=3422498 RepID=UPI003D7D5934
MSFSSLGLNSGLISHCGFSAPTLVQMQAIPLLLAGQDLLACAQTGTGKTAAFALPIIQRLCEPVADAAAVTAARGNGSQATGQPTVLVLTPTRELALQVGQAFMDFIGAQPLKVAVVFGGVNISTQRKLLAKGVDILVATPGRLFDLMYQQAVSLDRVDTLIIDEADRMLDMGFVKDIQRVKRALPIAHQSAMFSATLTPEISALAKTMLNEPALVNIEANRANQQIRQLGVLLDPRRKSEYLAEMIGKQNLKQVLVFTGSKQLADQVLNELQLDGISCVVLHGDRTQARRIKALEDFKSGAIRALVATDVAARGLDIIGLPLVVNFDLPLNPEDYLHRIGRTGRAGQSGEALSLLSPSERLALKAIEALMGETVSVTQATGYEPGAPLPARYEQQSYQQQSYQQAGKGGSQPSRRSGDKPGHGGRSHFAAKNSGQPRSGANRRGQQAGGAASKGSAGAHRGKAQR